MIYEWEVADELKAKEFYEWATSLEVPEGEQPFETSIHWTDDKSKVRIAVKNVCDPMDKLDIHVHAVDVCNGKIVPHVVWYQGYLKTR